MRAYNYRYSTGVRRPEFRRKRRRGRNILIVLVCLLVVGFLTVPRLLGKKQPTESSQPAASSNVNESQKTPEPPKEKPFNAEAMQRALASWATKNKGEEGVVVSDSQGNVLATSGAENTYFMASIYKLYVAYLGYQDIDSGKRQLAEPYYQGWTRGRCLDEMIRNSHSPCGEKLMAEITREKLNAVLKTYGFKCTTFGAFTTCSHDVAIMLKMIVNKSHLGDNSTNLLLDSLKGQKYRSGLPKGFANAVVYDKVGFNEDLEYHDVGIIELGDGRKLLVSVLTRGVGVASIAQLATDLQAAL